MKGPRYPVARDLVGTKIPESHGKGKCPRIALGLGPLCGALLLRDPQRE